MEEARPLLNYVPLKKKAPLKYKKSNPLIAIFGDKNRLQVQYGNRYVTSLNPQYFEYDYDLDSIKMQVDGEDKIINIGEKISVKKSFKVLAENEYRVNVIGYTRHGVVNENGLLIKRESIKPAYSIDKNENIFRVELYKGDKFSGMILIDFDGTENTRQPAELQESYSMNSQQML